jgi:mono/diheme cytochrome c family protein
VYSSVCRSHFHDPLNVVGTYKAILVGFPLLLLAACASQPQADPIVIQGTAVPPLPTLDANRVETGARVYAANCATCHGTELEGQPNWKQPKQDGSLRAPPHDSSGHTWHHPDDLLLDIIANGGDPTFGATMLGFQGQLSDDEMVAVLDFIKSHWLTEDREFQWWISAR